MNGAVKEFVVNVLGCKCQEEVFLDIELNRTPDPVGAIPLVFEIRVGGRLIIFGVTDKHIQGRLAAQQIPPCCYLG
jgi:hypothetical protein